ncbi:hypothetical protein [Streptomyces sp. NPDC059247]|uniref:hypothetical protein n=1 Tax=Streptomyces sp. NPDC059247 TaxID=3346790 RepID=UPI00368F70F6
MITLKKACAVAAAVGICAGALTTLPASAAPREGHIYNKQTDLFLSPGPYDSLDVEEFGRSGEWELRTPPGAAADVYQLKLKGTNLCIKALTPADVGLVECVANPGKPQRWFVTAGTGHWGTIQSRQYPGHFLGTTGGPVQLVETQQLDAPVLWRFAEEG